MAQKIKAMYPITLYNDGKNDREKHVINVNQDHLNENFRNIAEALLELYQSGEHTLNYLSARVAKDESTFVTMPDAQGIAAEAIAKSSVILMMPETIMQQVAETIQGYVATQDTTEPIQQAISSLVEQRAEEIDVVFTTAITSNSQRIERLSSWLKVVDSDLDAHTNAGVIIGRSDSAASFKAEASCIFFYDGSDDRAKWENALAGLDANGSFYAGSAHLGSVLLGDAFDIDKVIVGGVEFLHITGR